jgi:hypothetical protein
MAEPFTWHPTDIVVFNNVSGENLLLDLASGPQRLDVGRSLRITASALKQEKIKVLVDAGKIQVEPWRNKK